MSSDCKSKRSAFCPAHPPAKGLARSAKGGFTLIELLTVIAIIGILAAILIPVVGAVRDSARAAQCVSNLRQTTGALHIHLSENDGIFLSGQASDGTGNREDLQWGHMLENSGAINPGDIDVFFCPSQLAIRRDGGYPGQSTAVHLDSIWGWRTYGYNMFSDEVGVISGATSSGNSMFRLNANAIREPSRYPVFMDSVDDRGVQRFLIAGERAGDGRGGGVHLRHNDRANVAFLDGHVEAADQIRLRRAGLVSGYDSRENVVTFPRVP